MNPRNALAFALAFTFVPATVPAAKLCQEGKIRPTTPTEQFIIDADKGTVLDTKTGLMWKLCVEGRSGADCMTGSEQYLAWGEALRQAAASTHERGCVPGNTSRLDLVIHPLTHIRSRGLTRLVCQLLLRPILFY